MNHTPLTRARQFALLGFCAAREASAQALRLDITAQGPEALTGADLIRLQGIFAKASDSEIRILEVIFGNDLAKMERLVEGWRIAGFLPEQEPA